MRCRLAARFQPSVRWASSGPKHTRSVSQMAVPTSTSQGMPPLGMPPLSPPKPWKNTMGPSASSFCQKYVTEFKESSVEGAGKGWFASTDIPAGIRLRRVSVEDGSLLQFADENALRATGWDIDEAVHYGIGHKTDRGTLYYLNPGTPCNHADPLREVSVVYHMDKPGEMELWTVRDVKAGDELLIDYNEDYVSCDWYDKLCIDRGLTPLSKLGATINEMYKSTSVPMPWKNTMGTSAPSFCQKFKTEFKDSAIEGAGKGWWATQDIPAGVRLRRVSVDDGSLLRFADEDELRATSWDMDQAVHYGIGHKTDRTAVYYLNPGTPCNHADPSREVAVSYHMDKPGEMEMWSVRDIKAGEEILIDYSEDYVACDWYEKLCIERNLTPLSKLGNFINGLSKMCGRPDVASE